MTVATQSVADGENATEPGAPTRTGYTFGGWYTDAACTEVYDFANTAVTADITLYAKWIIRGQAVLFDSQGGTAVASQSVDYGKTAAEPTEPTRTGYTFGGWYKDAACTAAYDFATAVTADITLYAKWIIISYTVTFDANGGAFSGGTTTMTASVNHGDTASAPAGEPVMISYDLDGWCTDAAGTTAYDFTTAVTEEITLYAKWVPGTYQLALSEISPGLSELTTALASAVFMAVDVNDDIGGGVLTVPSGAALTVPSGKTLTLQDGITLDNAGNVAVDGTLNVTGDVTNSSSITVTSAHTLKIDGTFTNNDGATLIAKENGRIVAAQAIANNGGVVIQDSGTIEGTVNNNNWTLDKGALSVGVTGAKPGSAPWTSYAAQVTSLSFGNAVTTISAGSFAGFTQIQSVDLANVTGIQPGAFTGCSSLTSFSVPASNTAFSVKSDGALYDKAGTTLALYPAGATGDSGTFAVPSGTVGIGAGAFADCAGVSNVELPSTITTIANGAFTSTQHIECDGKANDWASVIGGSDIGAGEVTYTRAGDAVNGIVWDLYRKTGELKISLAEGSAPAAMDDYNNSSDAPWSDNRGSIESIVIEEGVTSIGDRAFYEYGKLTSVSIAGSVTSIGASAFMNCGKLASVIFAEGSSLGTIGSDSFRGCSSLTKIAIPKTVTTINSAAFYECTKLSELTFGEDSQLTTLGEKAFAKCSSLTGTLTIPSHLTNCEQYVFNGCTGLNGVVFEDGVQKIGADMFAGCTGLKGELVIPGSVTMIGAEAFEGCTGLTGVTIEENSSGASQTIGESFWYCTGITQVTIPKTARNIYGAFKGCSSLERIVLDPANEDYYLCDGVLCSKEYDGDSKKWLVACPAGKTGAFVIPDDITDIRDGAFTCCTGLTELTIGKSVGSEGSDGFENAGWGKQLDDLTSLTAFHVVDGNARYLAEDGVLYVKKKEVKNDVTVTKYELVRCPIGKEGPVSIKSDTVTEYNSGAGVFAGCSKVTSIQIPAGYSSYGSGLGYSALKDCTSLKEIKVEEGNEYYYSADGIVYTADKTKLYYCPPRKTDIDETKIPLVLATICDNAFRGSSLTALPIRENVNLIGENAFADSSIKTINYAGSKAQWEAVNNKSNLQDITVNYNAAIEEPPATLVDSGDCGATSADSVKWELYDNGKLVFSGNGNMKDYALGSKCSYDSTAGKSCQMTAAPWCNLTFNRVIFEDGVTGIGKMAFKAIPMRNVKITFGNGIKTIGESAFAECFELEEVTITGDGVEIG